MPLQPAGASRAMAAGRWTRSRHRYHASSGWRRGCTLRVTAAAGGRPMLFALSHPAHADCTWHHGMPYQHRCRHRTMSIAGHCADPPHHVARLCVSGCVCRGTHHCRKPLALGAVPGAVCMRIRAHALRYRGARALPCLQVCRSERATAGRAACGEAPRCGGRQHGGHRQHPGSCEGARCRRGLSARGRLGRHASPPTAHKTADRASDADAGTPMMSFTCGCRAMSFHRAV